MIMFLRSILAARVTNKRTGSRRGTSPCTTVVSSTPLMPPMPNGISATPSTTALPPTPLAEVCFGVHLMRNPRINNSFSSRASGARPTSPPSAAVSTIPSNDLVVMPQKFSEPSKPTHARSMYASSDSLSVAGLEWDFRSFTKLRSQYCCDSPENSTLSEPG